MTLLLPALNKTGPSLHCCKSKSASHVTEVPIHPYHTCFGRERLVDGPLFRAASANSLCCVETLLCFRRRSAATSLASGPALVSRSVGRASLALVVFRARHLPNNNNTVMGVEWETLSLYSLSHAMPKATHATCQIIAQPASLDSGLAAGSEPGCRVVQEGSGTGPRHATPPQPPARGAVSPSPASRYVIIERVYLCTALRLVKTAPSHPMAAFWLMRDLQRWKACEMLCLPQDSLSSE